MGNDCFVGHEVFIWNNGKVLELSSLVTIIYHCECIYGHPTADLKKVQKVNCLLCVFCLHVCMLSQIQLFAIPWILTHQAPLPMKSPGKNTGMDYHFLLQGIFLKQRSNSPLLNLPHWQEDSLPLSHLGNYVYFVYVV